jgi:peptide/nickel transport system substrate-binding protein
MSVLENVRIMDGERLEFTFTDCTRRIAKRALRVPILPAHVWRDRRQPATVGGVRVSNLVTEALITDNTPAVGSGPLRFEGNPSNRLVLSRFEDHFLHRGQNGTMPSWIEEGVSFDRLVVRVAVSELTAASSVADGTVDGVISPLGARALTEIEDDDSLQKLSEMSKSFYFIGYNGRRPPLTNPRFRNLLGRLIDEEYLIETVFEGEATPGASPLTGSDWLPTDLEWNDGDPETPFLGSDGELDVERAQTELKKAGYLYDNGDVVRR